ncbi:MAG: hypothetical protein ACFFEY_07490 [Candidatus Thorarchaeota archaeon]
MVENKNFIDSYTIDELFGLESNIFAQSIEFLSKKSKTKESFQKHFSKWKYFFTKIYGYEVNSDLFLKHTYFVHILKIIVIIKLNSMDDLNFEEIYTKYKKNHLRIIFEYQYFFWVHFDEELFKKIYIGLRSLNFAKEDLFTTIYQRIFLPETRHKLGEFFTPSILVNKMVDYSYEIGLKVLDPSCGSGNFIINIIIKIIDSKKPTESKKKAISKVYGFDINPLAIMTVRVNIFLLLLEYFNWKETKLSQYNIYLIDSLFPELYEKVSNFNLKRLYNSFDLIIGNPPWLTYKDLHSKNYQKKIRDLSDKLEIKPHSQYITHIELASIFFYAIPLKFLKINGNIFFVMPKSVLNGDHCDKFRLFSIFNEHLEIWDFPKFYFFNVNHICLKAEYIGKDNNIIPQKRYPILTKLFNDKLEFQEETKYTSLKIEDNGAKLILPAQDLEDLNHTKNSPYKTQFFQGATLVPRSLVFFNVEEKKNYKFVIKSDLDVLSRVKRNWKYQFQNKEIEQKFRFKTFLNKDLIPFFIKNKRNIFLPVNDEFDLDFKHLQNYPNALKFYTEINTYYTQHKKETSHISTLFENLNYWNKLKKQIKNKSFIVVYNASGSKLKASVINNQKQRVIIGSENYYYSSNSQEEVYYLSAVLNSPILSKNIKMIKSSRHIHKRPFLFPIPFFDEENLNHKELARLAKKCENVVQDLYLNNPKINSEKVRMIINRRLSKIDDLTNRAVFK